MKAMIFAAGVGRRLRPLTDHKPKALVELGGKPMILHVLEKLRAAGVGEVVVNIHHHAGQLRSFLESRNLEGLHIHISDETEQLLDTGGGMLQAADFLAGGQPFFLYNVDVLSDIRLDLMWDAHQRHKPLATLAVSARSSSRYFLWQDGLLAGWENIRSGQRILCREVTDLPSQGHPNQGETAELPPCVGEDSPCAGEASPCVGEASPCAGEDSPCAGETSLCAGEVFPRSGEDSTPASAANGASPSGDAGSASEGGPRLNPGSHPVSKTSSSQSNDAPPDTNGMLRRAFSGIHIVDPQIFSLVQEKPPFAIRDLYLRLAGKHRIMAFEHDPSFWADMGSPEKLEAARRLYLRFPKE